MSTYLRGGPFDGATAPEAAAFIQMIEDKSLSSYVMQGEGTVFIPRAITVETNEDSYRYELAWETDHEIDDVRYFYRLASKRPRTLWLRIQQIFKSNDRRMIQ